MCTKARQKFYECQHSIQKQDSMVSAAASKGALLHRDIHKQQLHINSHIKLAGTPHGHNQLPKTWRGYMVKKEQNGVRFLDNDNDPSFHSEGPCLLHFHSTMLPDICRQASQDWHFILQQTISLPSPHICLYNTDGNFEKTTSLPPHPSVGLQHNAGLLPHP